METLKIVEPLVAKFRKTTIDPLVERFVDRKETIELLAVTAVAGENLLLIGPPGTAKSQIVQDFAAELEGRYFECLLTRFSEPNELFGPVDIARLKEGIVETNTEGMLPDAEFAFIDEVFNGNSAILNSMLNVLNERTFRRGRERRRLALFCVVGASNRLPEDPGLRALYDRFLLRARCDPVSDGSLPLLFDRGWKIEQARIRGPGPADAPGARFTTGELRTLCSALPDVAVEPIRAPYLELVRRIRGAGVALSDRRVVRLLRLVAASALFCGRVEATPADFWVLRYAWDAETQAGLIDELVTQTIRAYVEQAEAAGPVPALHEMAVNRAGLAIADLGRRFFELAQRAEDATLTELERLDLKQRMTELLRLGSWIVPTGADDRRALGELTAQIKAKLK